MSGRAATEEKTERERDDNVSVRAQTERVRVRRERKERAYSEREIEVSFRSSGWHGDFEREGERDKRREEK